MSKEGFWPLTDCKTPSCSASNARKACRAPLSWTSCKLRTAASTYNAGMFKLYARAAVLFIRSYMRDGDKHSWSGRNKRTNTATRDKDKQEGCIADFNSFHFQKAPERPPPGAPHFSA